MLLCVAWPLHEMMYWRWSAVKNRFAHFSFILTEVVDAQDPHESEESQSEMSFIENSMTLCYREEVDDSSITEREEDEWEQKMEIMTASTTTEKILGSLRKCRRNSIWKEKLAPACLETLLTESCFLGIRGRWRWDIRRKLWKISILSSFRKCGTTKHLKVESRDDDRILRIWRRCRRRLLILIHSSRRTHVTLHTRISRSLTRCKIRLGSFSKKLMTWEYSCGDVVDVTVSLASQTWKRWKWIYPGILIGNKTWSSYYDGMWITNARKRRTISRLQLYLVFPK